ncbi:hypothetical protein GCM10007170_41840 [Arthrobacter liuii]|uniref:Tetracyclin repressor-like C-terminal domain-containing protein n=1 Tax=Arthrobacter liuii TaxID=1476996 RepID=A0ABQ2AYD5_9MICC|nr:hypothetical protein GCM10007170_41840 [Arthrobacter liuii]
MARYRPDPPPDHGSVRADLQAWAEQYIEEAASPTGREFLRDMVSGGADGGSAHRGGAYARQRVEVILERAHERGEQVPDLEDVIDLLLAPIVYRILFEPEELRVSYAAELTKSLFPKHRDRRHGVPTEK